ncbi:MAG: flagellin [Austwickia sp.]|nr:flagellin [Austwickia sp.]
MGLQINHNVPAINAYRNLTNTQSALGLSLERLSSGLRINRAADDAAGLAISEKLRTQVGGLNQSVSNAQHSVSLIQTAEGALNEVHAMLQRMRTLAVQSANDTNTDEDRKAIQKEVDALVKEIDSTATRTQFNGMNLLDGNFKDKYLQIGANQNQTMGVSIADLSAKGLNLIDRTEVTQFGTTATPATITLGIGAAVTAPEDGNYVLGSNKQVLLDGDVVGTYTATAINIDGKDRISATAGVFSEGVAFAISAGAVSGTTTVANVTQMNGQIKAGTYTVTTGSNVLDSSNNVIGKISTDGKTVNFTAGQSITFTSKLSAGGGFVIAAATADDVKKVDLSSRQGATNAIKMLHGAVGKISAQRAALGALQNRLSHTIKNLSVAAENLTASESLIRDTDMAKEMTAFTGSQILQQAGVSMLGQANQSAQSVLKLLG